MRGIALEPSHLLFAATVFGFFTLLAITGWTWPLQAAAALLPVAAFMMLI